MNNVTKVACIQFCSAMTLEENLPRLLGFVDEAIAQGAQWIITPETSNFMPAHQDMMRALVRHDKDDIFVAAFSEKAKAKKVWLQAGSFILLNEQKRPVNRSLLFAPNGKIVAYYDKIHLFDVTLVGGESHFESATYASGDRAVVTKMPFGNLGMSICYDLRFADLFRRLSESGADFITVPSAFTKHTGLAHWEILLRARAIETGCYVLAPAQVGNHENGRVTYGHSLIIDPWGHILAELTKGEGVITAELNLEKVEKTRRQLPVLKHGKEFFVQVNDDPL